MKFSFLLSLVFAIPIAQQPQGEQRIEVPGNPPAPPTVPESQPPPSQQTSQPPAQPPSVPSPPAQPPVQPPVQPPIQPPVREQIPQQRPVEQTIPPQRQPEQTSLPSERRVQTETGGPTMDFMVRTMVRMRDDYRSVSTSLANVQGASLFDVAQINAIQSRLDTLDRDARDMIDNMRRRSQQLI